VLLAYPYVLIPIVLSNSAMWYVEIVLGLPLHFPW